MAKFNEYPVKAKPADADTFYFIKKLPMECEICTLQPPQICFMKS